MDLETVREVVCFVSSLYTGWNGNLSIQKRKCDDAKDRGPPQRDIPEQSRENGSS